MLTRLSLSLIKAYQVYGRGFLPSHCRFVPSCSEFTRQAISKYGFWKGLVRGLSRIFVCHPFSGKSGYNPLE